VPVRKLVLKWVICMALVGSLFSPWLPVVARWAGKVGPGTGEEVSGVGLGGWAVPNALREFTHGYWVPEGTLGYAVYFALVLAAVGTAQVWLGKRAKGVLVLDMWLLFPLLCVAVLPTKMHVFESKHVLYTSPAVYLLAGFGITRIRMWGPLLCGALVLTNAASLSVYYQPEFQKEDWREVAGFLDERVEPGDAVYLDPAWILFSFRRYWENPQKVRTYLNSSVEERFNKEHLDRMLSESERVWLVHDFSEVIGPDRETWEYLSERLSKREEVLRREYFMGSVRVWLMERDGEKGEEGDEREP